MDFHEYANIFPMLPKEELEQLTDDINANGLLEPITLYESKILDGRNRFIACQMAYVEPEFVTYTGNDPLGFVISKNINRRHLTPSQAAAIALDVLPLLEEQARERQGQRVDLQPTSVKELTEVKKPQRATAAAAGLFHTNRQYISDAKKLQQTAPDIFEQVKTGQLSIPQAIKQVNGTTPSGASQETYVTLFSHENVEWYTPASIIELARQLLGQIDLDPASSDEAQKTVMAGKYFSETDNGLNQEWHGRVWLNPPYSKTAGRSNQEIWAKKLQLEYDYGHTTEAVLLVKSALGYKWFESLWDNLPVCFVRDRLNFSRNGGDNDSGESKQGTAIFYLGDNLDGFIDVFSQIGRITTPDGRYITR